MVEKFQVILFEIYSFTSVTLITTYLDGFTRLCSKHLCKSNSTSGTRGHESCEVIAVGQQCFALI